MTRNKPVSVRDHVRKLVDTLDDAKVSAMLAAAEPSPPGRRKTGPAPRAGTSGKPVTFRAAEEERAAWEAAADEEGFDNLGAWIRSCLDERLAQLESKRRR